MTIRSIIVDDDEPVARDVLSGYLQRNPYCPVVELVGQAQHIREAVPLIGNETAAGFPGRGNAIGNAFDILEACQDEKFETIFITA